MAGAISNQTTNLSNLSVAGLLDADRVSSTGTFTGALVIGSNLSSTNTVQGALGIFATSAKVGGGTAITSILATSLSLSTLTVAAMDASTATLAWTSLTTSHVVSINQTAALTQDYLNLRAWPSAAGVVTIVMNNSGNTQVVQASATLRAVAVKF